jgi:hypothetical protein
MERILSEALGITPEATGDCRFAIAHFRLVLGDRAIGSRQLKIGNREPIRYGPDFALREL